jgi:DNA-binding HxlR family transcriptional regulator
LNLKHLEQEGLIKRRIVTTKPIQSLYSLSEKGAKIARKLADVRKTLYE